MPRKKQCTDPECFGDKCAVCAPYETTPAEWLDLLIEKAPSLRAAGVLTVQIDGYAAQLSPAPVDPGKEPEVTTDWTSDPLNDPDTFGGSVPKLPGRGNK